MGENTTKAWTQTKTYKVPEIGLSAYKMDKSGYQSTTKYAGITPEEGSILDYMGIPTKMNNVPIEDNEMLFINALQVRGYVKIWNEWFRDQNLTDPVTENKGDTNREDAKTYNYAWADKAKENATQTVRNESATRGMELLPVAKFHDYFTSALPEPQKGPTVSIALSGNAPVGAYSETIKGWATDQFKIGAGGTTNDVIYNNAIGSPKTPNLYVQRGSGGLVVGELQADLTNVNAATVNELRQAFAVQHYYEALARGGSRYREIIRSMFGTLISDKTVQIPEYLGGGRYMINVSQVVQTSSSTESSPQGNASAISVTPFTENSFTKSFEEHGFVIGVLCVRHDHTYQQGIERLWSRKDTLDYYFPQFANLGEQAIKRQEIYVDKNSEEADREAVFGYQEAWSEYRMKPNRVCGKFRSNAEGTLDSWHYADNYSKTPYLSDEWINEGKEEIQRTLAVQDEPQFIADILIKNNTTRPMPLYSVPGLEKL